MKRIENGPSGALMVTVERGEEGVRLKLLFMLSSVHALTAWVGFAGKRRSRLRDRTGRFVPALQRELRPSEKTSESEAISKRLHWMRSSSLVPWTTEIELSATQLKGVRYLTLYVGDPAAGGQDLWYLRPETILLEASASHWGLTGAVDESHFLLITRGNAAQRLKCLQQKERVLQSHHSDSTDALFDIYFLLIGGKDTTFLTCDLEGGNDEE